MRKLVLMFTWLFCIVALVSAQTKQITGTVYSAEDGGTLPGVTIQVKGTTLGTISDVDGNFSLQVPNDATALTFSFVGMETVDVEIEGKTKIKLSLEPSSVTIDEVVITAFGISRDKKSLGYAATTVGADDLTMTRSSNLMESMSGKVAGVQISSSSSSPGASNSVVIRGFTSLGGSNQPLYIIDGVPLTNNTSAGTSLDGGYDFGNAANLVNNDDVENVTILKGAAATALYGNRAANGVIIITTKTGKGKAKVEFNSSVEFSDILRLPDFQNDFGMGWDAHHTLNENGSWGPRLDGSTRLWGTVYENSQKLKAFTAQENNLRDFFDYGVRYNNSVSLSGGDDVTSYYSSISINDQDGLVPTDIDSYRKYTATLKGSHKIGRLTVSSNINYSQQDNSFAQTGQGLTIINSLYQTPRDISIVSLKDYKTDPFDNVDYYYTPYGITNPYYLIDQTETSFGQKKIFGKMQFDLELTSELNLTYRFGLDASDNETKLGSPEVQATAGSPNDGASTNQEGAVVKSMQRRHEYTQDLLLTFSKSINDIEINAILGSTLNERNFSSVTASVTGLDIPGFYNLSNSSSTPSISEYYSKRRLVGAFADIDLGYKNLLFLHLTARNDWSSTLPAENNSFFYPGATASFIFTELLSEEIQEVFNFGKLRVAYGQTGNDAGVYSIDPSFIASSIYNPFRSLDFPLTIGDNKQNAFEVGNLLGNQELTPEITTEFEFGVEGALFSNRLSFDVSVYDRTSVNQIFGLGLAPSTGYTSQTTNLGEINNKGIEVLVGLKPIKTNDFSWELSVNYSSNKNELVSLPEELGDKIDLGGTSTIGFVAQVGKPLGLYEITVPKYSPSGQIIVNSGSGRPEKASEKEIIEKADIDYAVGISNQFKYKNLSLAFDFDIRQGGLMYSRTADINYFTGNITQTTYNSRHTFIIPNSVNAVEGDGGEIFYVENTTPISKEDFDDYFADGGAVLDHSFLLPRDMVKLKRVAISYNIPKRWIASLPIEGASLTAFGTNLLLWTPAENNLIDPETTTFGNDLAGKYGEFTANPSTRNWGFNLKLNF